MRRPLAGLLLLLSVGCSTTAATPAAPDAASSAPAAGPSQAVGELSGPTDFRVRLDPTEVPAEGPDGQQLVRWTADWTLTWQPSPGAQDYAVWFGTNEGAPEQPRQYVGEHALRLTAATGTSPRERLALDRDAGLVFTSSQLLVSVAARDAGGRLGPRSPWFPVGDVPADGRPVGTAAPGHEGAHYRS